MAKLVDADALKEKIKNEFINYSTTRRDVLALIDSLPDISPDSSLINKHAVKNKIEMSIQALKDVNVILEGEYYSEEKK